MTVCIVLKFQSNAVILTHTDRQTATHTDRHTGRHDYPIVAVDKLQL